MALPKMQRVFAAAAVAALLMAGAPGRAEAAGDGTASGAAQAWSAVWNWALSQFPGLRLWLGEDQGRDGDNEHRRGRPAGVPPPPEVDKGSGLDPNGGSGGG